MVAQAAILVEFTIKSGSIERFRELIVANARASLRDEEGCRRFDVLSPADDPTRIVLYEIYDNDRAFELHLQTPHYRTFAAASEGMIDNRLVRRLTFLNVHARASP
jgi:(4S)-4-hydroxy-5-phosphonooxypentane-2,3-dione isomerase